jgi:hypothetical protein
MGGPPPRWLPADEAVRYVGLGTEGFRRAVRRGTLPEGSYALGKQSPRWDRVALDRAMGAPDAANGMEEIFNALAEKSPCWPVETRDRPIKTSGKK